MERTLLIFLFAKKKKKKKKKIALSRAHTGARKILPTIEAEFISLKEYPSNQLFTVRDSKKKDIKLATFIETVVNIPL